MPITSLWPSARAARDGSLCPFLAWQRHVTLEACRSRSRFDRVPEPEPPDFERLPVGTQGLFVQRQERLPIGRVRTSIGAQAVMTNESRALHRFEVQNALTWDCVPLSGLGTCGPFMTGSVRPVPT